MRKLARGNCSSSFVQGISWLLVNSAMNATMNYSAKAGEWFLTAPRQQMTVVRFSFFFDRNRYKIVGFLLVSLSPPPNQAPKKKTGPNVFFLNDGGKPRCCPLEPHKIKLQTTTWTALGPGCVWGLVFSRRCRATAISAQSPRPLPTSVSGDRAGWQCLNNSHES